MAAVASCKDFQELDKFHFSPGTEGLSVLGPSGHCPVGNEHLLQTIMLCFRGKAIYVVLQLSNWFKNKLF